MNRRAKKEWERHNIERDAARLNQQYFDGELVLDFPMVYRSFYRQYGMVNGKRNRQTGDSWVTELSISNRYNMNEDDYLGILAHELIHVKLMQNGQDRWEQQHGPFFRHEVNRIIKMGLEVPLSESVKKQEMDVGKPLKTGVNAIIIDGEWIMIFRSYGGQEVLDRFISNIEYNAYYKKRTITLEYVTTTNPVVRNKPIARSLKTVKRRSYKMEPEMYEALKPDITGSRTIQPEDYKNKMNATYKDWKTDTELPQIIERGVKQGMTTWQIVDHVVAHVHSDTSRSPSSELMRYVTHKISQLQDLTTGRRSLGSTRRQTMGTSPRRRRQAGPMETVMGDPELQRHFKDILTEIAREVEIVQSPEMEEYEYAEGLVLLAGYMQEFLKQYGPDTPPDTIGVEVFKDYGPREIDQMYYDIAEAFIRKNVAAVDDAVLGTAVPQQRKADTDWSDWPIRIYLANLRAYNEGKLEGEWIELPMDEDELKEAYDRVSEGGKYEVAIHDSEAPFSIGEQDNVANLNALIGEAEDMNFGPALFGVVVDSLGLHYMKPDQNVFEDISVYGTGEPDYDEEDFGYELYSEQYNLEEILPKWLSVDYINWERLGKDYIINGGGTFSNGYVVFTQ